MTDEIIDLHDWLKTPMGQYVAAWESSQYDRALVDIFGFNALQLGLPELPALRSNRMPHRWYADGPGLAPRPSGQIALLTDFSALPFAPASLDLVVLPHTLELSSNPHATLREVERVLVPEGRVVIAGFNPAAMWALRHPRVSLRRYWGGGDAGAAEPSKAIGYWRLRDWLHLLSFEVESSHYGCYRPKVQSQGWLERWDWLDKLGQRWWPILGSVYFVVAVKRVRGMRLLEPAWKTHAKVAGAPVSVANQLGHPPSPHSSRESNS